MSAGGPAEQPLVLLRGCRLAAETAVVEGAVVVAAAGRHHAETAGQGSKPGTFGKIMIGMPHFDPGQTRGGQPDDDLVRYLVPRRAGMGKDGHAARGADQGDRADRVGGVAAGVRTAAVTDPLPGERVSRGVHHAGRGERAGSEE